MNTRPGMGMQKFLKLKCMGKDSPEALKSLSSSMEGMQSFREGAESLGAEALWIQSAEYMSCCYADALQDEAAWFLLYCLEMNGRGHIRISAEDLKEDFPIWCGKVFSKAEGLAENPGELIRQNPRLFAPLARQSEGPVPLLYGPEYSFFYLYRQYSFEQAFLVKLSSFCGEAGRREVPEKQFAILDDIASSLQGEKGLIVSPEAAHGARLCLNYRLSVITGGPGTGKTTLLAGMLRIYQESFRRCGLASPRIRLCAPTGRASQRMSESLGTGFPMKGETIHKLLGLRPGTPSLYGKGRELDVDLLVVDEASMVDLRLMDALLGALKSDAALLLVGDRDQLPSVESGALLSDLLHHSERPGHPLENRVISLKKVHRSRGALLEAASLVLQGKSLPFKAFLKDEAGRHRKEGRVIAGALPEVSLFIRQQASPEFFGFVSEKSFPVPSSHWESQKEKIESWFKHYQSLVILSPLRRGLWGSLSVNRRLDEALAPGTAAGAPYHGRPVMITRNDYKNGLFNGDRGIVFHFKDGFFIFFKHPQKGLLFHPFGLLENLETAYAMTVHKSQGSEYDRVVLLLPEGGERLLSREILYTGITRARQELVFFYGDAPLDAALSRHIRRHSGIRDFMSTDNNRRF